MTPSIETCALAMTLLIFVSFVKIGDRREIHQSPFAEKLENVLSVPGFPLNYSSAFVF